MRRFIITKTGYYKNTSGWQGDYFTVLVIKEDEYRVFDIRVGYEGTYPITQKLKELGYEEMYSNNQVYGMIKKSEYTNFEFCKLEDILDFAK
jgi:hypothetical protein